MNDTISVSLKFAIACLDCGEISRSRGDRCVICGSAAVMSLPKLLNRIHGVPPSKPFQMFAREGTA